MSWAAVTPATGSWGASTATSAAWGGVSTSSLTWGSATFADGEWTPTTVAVVPPSWGLLSSLASIDNGVDFRLTLHANYPWRLSADRPVALYDVQPEGAP